jgi:hypothetical protein
MLLKTARAQSRLLVADNGNFDAISKLIERFGPEADSIHAERRKLEDKLGHRVRPGDLPEGPRDRYRRLAAAIEKAARELTSTDYARTALAIQTEVGGNYMIGMEDLSVATLTGLGVAREYLGRPLGWYRRYAEPGVRWAERTRSGQLGPHSGLVFAGLHGLDMDTARLAGAAAGRARLDGIACGLGGALTDTGYTDFRVEDSKVASLGPAVPRPYLRVAEVAAGMHLGYAEETGKRPRFHALGVGTPILLPLLAALGDRDTYLATDSTAPISDAYSSLTISLYIERPAAMKLKAHRIVETWLQGGPGWDCGCPYCKGFRRKHPSRARETRAWWRAEGQRRLEPGDLHAPSPLADLQPLLGSPSDDDTRREAGMARIGHNHWVLRRLELAAQRHATTPASLVEWADGHMQRYLASPADPAWRTAVAAAWPIVKQTADRLASAEPGGELPR